MTEVDGKVCMLELIDTAGQEGYSSLRDNYSLQSDVLLLVYSISSFTSFEYLQTLFLHSQRLLLSADKLNVCFYLFLYLFIYFIFIFIVFIIFIIVAYY